MIDITTSSNVSQTVWIGAPGVKEPKFIACYFYVVNPTLLGSAAVIVRWNDGLSAKSFTQVLALSALGNFKSDVFAMIQAAGTDLTYEVAVSGGATVGLLLGYASVN